MSDSFDKLVAITSELREKCPWDNKQTLDSLKKYTLEEVYELHDAIDKKNYTELKEELGDILFHLLFYTKIAAEEKQFSLEEMLDTQCKKLIFRHPHIYAAELPEGLQEVKNEEDVKLNWQKIKLKEGKKSVLEGVPTAMPAVIKANNMQTKAAAVGFDWENADQVWGKVYEEIDELKEAQQSQDIEKITDELGDVLFSIVNLSRFLKVDAEQALQRTNEKFKKRFQYIEQQAAAAGTTLQNMSLEEMEKHWQAAKSL